MAIDQGVLVSSTLDSAERWTTLPACKSAALADRLTASHFAETLSEAAIAPEASVAEALAATNATIACEPAAGSLSCVAQVVPLLQKVSIRPEVVSQNMSTCPIAPTSTEVVAVSFTGLPGPTTDGWSDLSVTPNQLTWMGLEAMPSPADGIVAAGRVMKAANECTPEVAL